MLKGLSRAFPVLLLCFLLCACSAPVAETDSSAAFASVNGEVITRAEIDYFTAKYRAETAGDFISEYTLEYSADFWDTPAGGTTPRQALEKRALEEAVSAKIKLVLMRENGIYTDISYAGLQKKAEDFNRSETKPEVGLKSIPLDSFYTYYIQTGEMQLKQLLAETVIKPAQAEIDAYIARTEELQAMSEADAQSTARSALTDKGYEEYISDLIEKADIKIL